MALARLYTYTPDTKTSYVADDLDAIIAFANEIRDGKSGGGTFTGGTGAGQNITIRSTAHATKGKHLWGADSAYDEALVRLGIGKQNPAYPLDISRAVSSDAVVQVQNLAAGGFSGFQLLNHSGTAGMFFGLDNGATTARMNAFNNFPWVFLANSAEKLRIETTGLRLSAVNGSGALTLDEQTSSPSNPSSSNQARVYLKADKLVFVFNDGGTIRYKYLDLTGTGVTWVHTTTAP